MKISNNPPQHLANFEVLQHFLQLKEDTDVLQTAVTNHSNREILRAREQVPFLKKQKDYEPDPPEVPDLSPAELEKEDRGARRGVSPELVWIQEEVLKYLCADYNITARQTANGVATVADQLQDYGLTKAELLQVCNLAPRSQVGLYLIIEEAENRLPQPYEDTMNDIITSAIVPSLLPEVPENLLPYVNTVQATDIAQNIMDGYAQDEEMYYEDEEEQFVHEAEWGAAREGAIDDAEDNTMD